MALCATYLIFVIDWDNVLNREQLLKDSELTPVASKQKLPTTYGSMSPAVI